MIDVNYESIVAVDSIFLDKPNYSYNIILNLITDVISKKEVNIPHGHGISQKMISVLHSDDISTIIRNFFTKKIDLFSPDTNNSKMLANYSQFLLLATLAGKKSLNFYRTPVRDMKHNYLLAILLKVLEN